jgi:hypothetical protein
MKIVNDTNVNKDHYGSELTTFRELLEAFTSKPRPPKVEDYDVRERRKDTQKLSIILSALSTKKDFRLPPEEVLALKQLFQNT